MGCGWRTFSNFSEGTAPVRWVGRIGRDPVRVIGLNLAQPEQKPVIFGITDDGVIHYVIAIVVEVELLFEFCVTLLKGLIIHISHL